MKDKLLKYYFCCLFFSIPIFIIRLSCNENSGAITGNWKNLAFPETAVYKLFYYDGYIYACAGYDGLWRLNINGANKQWEYLGHKVTEGERHREAGAQTVNVYGNSIFLGYISPTQVSTGDYIGVWNSTDWGTTWLPADSGIRNDTTRWSSARSIIRSKFNPEIMYLGFGNIYRTLNGGGFWHRVYPESELILGSLHFGLIINPFDSNIIWAFGESNFFQPLLRKSSDAGETWQNLEINIPRDNALFDMAFDALNQDIIYISSLTGVIRSTQGGNEWFNNDPVPMLFRDTNGNSFHAIETHPSISGVLFAAAGNKLYTSKNFGNTIYRFNIPPQLLITYEILYDKDRNVLYAAGYGGVFELHDPLDMIP